MLKSNPDNLYGDVKSFIEAALLECASRKDFQSLKKSNFLNEIIPIVLDDLLAFSKKDPAAKNNPIYILKSYTSFSAVLHYRISNWIYKKYSIIKEDSLDNLLPNLLLRRGKLLSGEWKFG